MFTVQIIKAILLYVHWVKIRVKFIWLEENIGVMLKTDLLVSEGNTCC